MSEILTQSVYQIGVNEKWVIEDEAACLQDVTENDAFELLKTRFNLEESMLLEAFSRILSLPVIGICDIMIDPVLIKKFTLSVQQKNRFIPLYSNLDEIGVLVDNPFNTCIDMLKKSYTTVTLLLTHAHELDTYFGQTKTTGDQLTILDKWLYAGIERHASDIHFNKTPSGVTIAFRCNGKMQIMDNLNDDVSNPLIAMLKLHANLDISVGHIPQDGRLSVTYKNSAYDIRVASLPTVHGEDFVCRIFQSTGFTKPLNELGLSDTITEQLTQLLTLKSGLFLVTGPTGSGKTTTLYSCIQHLLKLRHQTIITLEDPVEALVPGVRQSAISPKAGYTFVSGLKAILRQDPDVILIGEIRDKETAKIALEAAYTGHLVISTLHTSNCEATRLRLEGFGLDPFMLNYSLKGILSQKLCPQICQSCKTVESKSSTFTLLNQQMSLPVRVSAPGCSACFYSGVSGRMILSEIATYLTPELDSKNSSESLNKSQNNIKYNSFFDDASHKLLQGLVTVEDVIESLAQ